MVAPARAPRPENASARPPDLGSAIHRAVQTAGQPLPETVRALLETHLDTDLADVRVHVDSEADALSRAVQAQAFTTGQHIFFKDGAFQPDTPAGQRLLAHEVTHTRQQAEGAVSGTLTADNIRLSDPADPFEQAAEASAHALTPPTSAHVS